jgi:flagellar biosynthesis/type III secretory pathway M-ring protein FliF/YscJ
MGLPLKKPLPRPDESLSEMNKAERELLQERIAKLVKQSPEKAAVLISEWLKESDSKRRSGK